MVGCLDGWLVGWLMESFCTSSYAGEGFHRDGASTTLQRIPLIGVSFADHIRYVFHDMFVCLRGELDENPIFPRNPLSYPRYPFLFLE